jgi:hypothetical protein
VLAIQAIVNDLAPGRGGQHANCLFVVLRVVHRILTAPSICLWSLLTRSLRDRLRRRALNRSPAHKTERGLVFDIDQNTIFQLAGNKLTLS